MKTILPGEIHFLTTRKRVQPAAFILNSSYKSRQVGLNFFLLPFHFFFACFQSLKTFLQFSIILPFLAFSFFIFPSLSFFPSFVPSFFLSFLFSFNFFFSISFSYSFSHSFSQFLFLIPSLILSLICESVLQIPGRLQISSCCSGLALYNKPAFSFSIRKFAGMIRISPSFRANCINNNSFEAHTAVTELQ